jgi:predicted enzyme related to lactoylglutathione lyase
VEALQADPRRAGRYYGALFGWDACEQQDGYAVARVRGRDVAGIGPTGPLATPAWITRVRVTHVEETVAAALAAGGSLIGWQAPARLALLADPAGAPFAVWQADAGGAQLVNEPGSWDLSTLRTPAPDQAQAFYGALFGWHAEPYGAITLWRLHGYCGGLAEQPVPRDTVAIMVALDGAHAQAGWSVDFRVRDTDASAERAVRLGAAIVAAPHDASGFRTAVLADPQGAEFSITRFG